MTHSEARDVEIRQADLRVHDGRSKRWRTSITAPSLALIPTPSSVSAQTTRRVASSQVRNKLGTERLAHDVPGRMLKEVRGRELA